MESVLAVETESSLNVSNSTPHVCAVIYLDLDAQILELNPYGDVI
jgi:hypothetical protein